MRISSLISLDGYLQVKKDLLEEAGVSDVDTPYLVYKKIIRHCNMAKLWKMRQSLLLLNNDMLVRDYGKYNPDIVFVLKDEYKSYIQEYEPMHNDMRTALNIPWDGEPTVMYGRYWIGSKGTLCFTPTSKEMATHLLIKNSWGGAFDHTRGREYDLVSPMAEYSKSASSNGGGLGYSYYVLKIGVKNVITIDDI